MSDDNLIEITMKSVFTPKNSNNDFRRNNVMSQSKANPSILCAKQSFIFKKVCLSYAAFIFFVQRWQK